MLKDRGKKKWAPAAFMPEHTKLLKDMYYEELKVSMPILDEYEFQEINEKIMFAFEKKIPVKLNLFFDGFKEWEGPLILKKLDNITNVIKTEKIVDKSVNTFNLRDIIGVEYE